ncbi:TonB-dependent receptor domain-containing protein [Telmatospirillum sp.]|uniref:TonB-dependent receptor plug domain-containing protein n=1 Tax=Telmatospirillum sp. TaxID=2079197 RepID=UPI0028512677|nr:TonB-dependent receptor [Telmatospirillum sp.]MDR3435637.1 TonB-dependent receptor [Telmatospirillum sp.]
MSFSFRSKAGRPAFASLSFIALSALSLDPAAADEIGTTTDVPVRTPIVVSATRLPTPAAEVASSVTVITDDEMEQKQQRTLPDVLRDVPGLNLVQTGQPGGAASIYMRGTNPNHTKVLIDGMEVSDPSSVNGAFDFSKVLTSDIERIEVLRGPQSGLYGSDAIGGVINITTKKGEGPAKVTASVEGGTSGTFNQTAGASGSEGRFNYAVDLSHNRSVSEEVTPSNLIPPGEKRIDDVSDNRTFSTRLGADLTDNLEVGLVARAIETELLNTGDHYDYGSRAMVPDGSHSFNEGNEFFTRGTLHQALFDGVFDHTLGVAYSDHRRRYAATDGVPNYYRGDRVKGDWQGNIRLAQGETLTLGAESQRESIDDAQIVYGSANDARAHVSNNAGFVQLQSDWNKRLENAVSLRYDDNSRSGSKVTYRVAPALLLPETGTKLKASVGTGFKAPSLDQLYDNYPAYGFTANPNLRPEKSLGFDVGFEQKAGIVEFGSTYFYNSIDDLITYTATTYTNVAKAKTQGFENFAAVSPIKTLTLRADYTYTLAEDDVSHQELLRRPKHKASLTSIWQATKALSLSASLLVTGDWVDTDREGSVPRLKANGYTTVNLTGNYALSDNLSLFARVTNLFDRRIETPVGYQQPGVGGFGGVKASF